MVGRTAGVLEDTSLEVRFLIIGEGSLRACMTDGIDSLRRFRFDAMGNILEHYSDGDVVNEDTPQQREVESPNSLYIWGPNLPSKFPVFNPIPKTRRHHIISISDTFGSYADSW
jgi:hypothetical protein